MSSFSGVYFYCFGFESIQAQIISGWSGSFQTLYHYGLTRIFAFGYHLGRI
jgi:hypothetical protein